MARLAHKLHTTRARRKRETLYRITLDALQVRTADLAENDRKRNVAYDRRSGGRRDERRPLRPRPRHDVPHRRPVAQLLRRNYIGKSRSGAVQRRGHGEDAA
jgi:hypothetical protein